MVSADVHDPLMRPISAQYGMITDDTGSMTAVIEMAAASGLTLLSEEERDPLVTSTFGTGELVLDALDKGCRNFVMAIGGSATNDGGTGLLRALGVRLLGSEDEELEGRGCDLVHMTGIDASGLDPRIRESQFTVMCDVTNPLCGLEGATMVFGPQKGADDSMAEQLEHGMCNWRDLIKEWSGFPYKFIGTYDDFCYAWNENVTVRLPSQERQKLLTLKEDSFKAAVNDKRGVGKCGISEWRRRAARRYP